MKKFVIAIGLLASALPAVSWSQQNAISEGNMEVIVTAQRRDAEDYSSEIPAIGLVRKADFAVVTVSVMGDSRDRLERQNEIYAMVRGAIEAAPRAGVELAYGARTLEPLTMANYKDLSLRNDSRPDSQRVTFLAKVPLAGTDAKTAEQRIATFIKSVKPVGRALMERSGEMQLSIVAPDKYRGQVADLIIADAKAMGEKLGPDYSIQIEGLNRPVEWARAGLSEVMIYIPYRLVVGRKP
ncbi:MAG TPA: TonB-dependent receptor [Novosphingobium sp.]|nr:TonB-dependent receptor [Novosphingobium sp.]